MTRLPPISGLTKVALKRLGPQPGEENDRAIKAVKVLDFDVVIVPKAHIANLELQIKELHDFLDKTGLAKGSRT